MASLTSSEPASRTWVKFKFNIPVKIKIQLPENEFYLPKTRFWEMNQKKSTYPNPAEIIKRYSKMDFAMELGLSKTKINNPRLSVEPPKSSQKNEEKSHRYSTLPDLSSKCERKIIPTLNKKIIQNDSRKKDQREDNYNFTGRDRATIGSRNFERQNFKCPERNEKTNKRELIKHRKPEGSKPVSQKEWRRYSLIKKNNAQYLEDVKLGHNTERSISIQKSKLNYRMIVLEKMKRIDKRIQEIIKNIEEDSSPFIIKKRNSKKITRFLKIE